MPHLAVFSARVEAGARHAMLHPRAGLVALIAAVAFACAWAAPASAAGLDVPAATGNVAHVGSHAVDTTLAAAPAVIERATPTVVRAATALEPARPVAEPVVKSVTRGVASEIPAVAGRTADSVTTAVDRPQRADPVRTPASAAPVRAPASNADPAPRGPRLSGNERTAATAPAAIGSSAGRLRRRAPWIRGTVPGDRAGRDEHTGPRPGSASRRPRCRLGQLRRRRPLHDSSARRPGASGHRSVPGRSRPQPPPRNPGGRVATAALRLPARTTGLAPGA